MLTQSVPQPLPQNYLNLRKSQDPPWPSAHPCPPAPLLDSGSTPRFATIKGVIRSKIKPAIKHKTSPATHAQLLQSPH